jgi:4-hydroxythreonine-4-phosphate dehydrogenase
MTEPTVVVTMGDPCGVGPEVVLKALESTLVRQRCRVLILGDWQILQRTQRSLERPRRVVRRPFELVPWHPGDPIPDEQSVVAVYSLSSLSAAESYPGRPGAACGKAVYCYIKRATELILSGTANALATGISKRVLHLAGYRYPGHTELLGKLTGTNELRMMLLGPCLKIVLATVHVPYRSVPRELTRQRIVTTLRLAHVGLRERFDIRRPRLAVAALNPHAGEDGIFGQEEKTTVRPAIRQARKHGIQAYGPFPADTVFRQAVEGVYDAVICMYHDQGLIPLKLLYFFDGVALTLGLPFVRTSVDHGTGYDIAGKNLADGSSMREAILLAAKLATTDKR